MVQPKPHFRASKPTQPSKTFPKAPSTLSYSPRTTPLSPAPPESTRRTFWARRVPIIGASLAAASIGYLCVATYTGYQRDVAFGASHTIPHDVSSRYNFTADTFDDSVSFSEWLLGIDRLRGTLLARARGHVFESAVGTARNGPHYVLMPRGKDSVTSVTMADKSREMVYEARRKWANGGNAFFRRTAFYVADCAGEKVRCAYTEDGKFDTVVQTMGVCSFAEPVEVLKNLGEMTNKEGKILLLEHGRSRYDWVNRMLDATAPAHADRHGCWWNRDPGEIVRASGLQIVEEKRFDVVGTTWWFVLKPPTITRDEVPQQAETAAMPSTQGTVKSWLPLWSG